MNPCEWNNKLTAWLLGELHETEADALQIHIDSCAECNAAAGDLRKTLAVLSNALNPESSSQSEPKLDSTRRAMLLAIQPEPQITSGRHWFFRIHPAFAAAAAAVVVLSVVMLGIISIDKIGMNVSKSDFIKACESGAEVEMNFKSVDGDSSSPDTPNGRFSVSGRLITDSKAGAKEINGTPVRRDALHKSMIDSDPFAEVTESTLVSFDDAKMDETIKSDPFAEVSRDRSVGFGSAGNMDITFDSGVKTKPVVTEQSKSKQGLSGQRRSLSEVGGGYSYGDKAGSKGTGLMLSAKPQEGGVQEMENLKIALPKPQFTGTPKDLNGLFFYSRREKNISQLSLEDGRAVKNHEVIDDFSVKPQVPLPARVFDVISAPVGGKAGSEGKLGFDLKPSTAEVGDSLKANASLGSRIDKLEVKPEKSSEQRETVLFARIAAPQEPHNALAKEIMLRRVAATDEPMDRVEKSAKPVPPISFNPFIMTSADNFSTFAIDVDTASYTLTRQAIRSGNAPKPEKVRTEEIVNAFDYGDKAPISSTFRVYQDGAQSPFGAGLNMLRIGVKGRRLGREEQRPAILTFVIDTSGSMAQPDRIGLARQALTLLVGQLSERDRIQIIAYNDHARLVLEPVTILQKERILKVFRRLQCNGSTNLEEGLQLAYTQAVESFVPGAENRVILISDGVANLGSGSAQEILDKVASCRRQGITCSVFGVGSGTYNDRMLEQLANKGDGVYKFLDSADEVKRAFVDELSATLNTIAKDAKIQVEWNPKVVRRYRQLGYENRALKKEQFRDNTVDAGEVGSGQSVTAMYELELMPGARADAELGTVRVRYQRTDTGRIEEIETTLKAASVLRPAHKATNAFRIAASAAEFAELLRGCPHAAGAKFQDVADYLRPAAMDLTLDTRVKELLELVMAME